MVIKTANQRFVKVLEQVKTIRHVACLRSTGVGRANEGTPAVSADSSNLRMLGKPCTYGFCRVFRQEVQNSMSFQIAKDRAVAHTLAKSPVSLEEQRELIRHYVKAAKTDPAKQEIEVSFLPALFSRIATGAYPDHGIRGGRWCVGLHFVAEEVGGGAGEFFPEGAVLPEGVGDLSGVGFVLLEDGGLGVGEGGVEDVEVGFVVEAEGGVVEVGGAEGDPLVVDDEEFAVEHGGSVLEDVDAGGEAARRRHSPLPPRSLTVASGKFVWIERYTWLDDGLQGGALMWAGGRVYFGA